MKITAPVLCRCLESEHHNHYLFQDMCEMEGSKQTCARWYVDVASTIGFTCVKIILSALV